MDCPLHEPSLQFRKYQSDVLAQANLSNKEMLIVAPPGSGKTIIGLELIRRIGKPAIVFAPTTIIARQWKDKLSYFCNNSDDAASLDSDVSAFLNIVTYQRISTRSEASASLEKMARDAWISELCKTIPQEEALLELGRIEKLNKENYDKRIASYVSKLRREADRSVIAKGLHKNALELVARMKAAGVKVIILDECHHLLDYWGLVIAYLKLELDAQVIGLTATYPIAEEKDVFFDLLPNVNYEVSTPAVVKEGFLAPYRELAYFVSPTSSELELIQSQIKRTSNVFRALLMHPMYPEFVKSIVEGDSYKDDYALYSLVVSGKSAVEPDGYDECLLLIKGFLDYAYPIMPEEDQKKAFHLLKTNGFTYSNKVLRVADTVEKQALSYSENRVLGAISILRKESDAMKTNLRALIMVDFDTHVPSASVSGMKAMGSAAFVFIRLLKDLDELDPVLVTGTRLYCDDDLAERFREELLVLAKEKKFDISITFKHMDGYAILEGEGKDWRPSTYTILVTSLFSKGLTRLLIGTKALFGEGWDSLKLNTMVDLTAISFGTSVQQIRGRALRIDPEDPLKVSNNWDIVCVYPGMFSQLSKMRKKHGLLYSVDDQGRIMKGVDHLEGGLWRLWTGTRDSIAFRSDMQILNDRMINRAISRNKTRELWGIGSIYEDSETGAVEVKMEQKVVPVSTLRFLYLAMYAFLVMSVLSALYSSLTRGGIQSCITILVFWFVFFFGVSAAIFVHTLRNPVPDDKIVCQMAKAVLATLKMIGLSDDSSTLKITPTPVGTVEIALSGKGSREFANAMGELLSRPINPRYVILYDVVEPLHWLLGIYGLFSHLADKLGIRKRYFAVPALFAANKKNTEIFSMQWRNHVGGGTFIYTRTVEGVKLLSSLVKSNVPTWVAEISEKIYWDYIGSSAKNSRNVY
ncbi:DEAD/DEAH box helicase family protein [Candidatus Micrarchaeota archaeon]|nr:DEAD/DEAH box helicase family protein [Candidatus Micrarchaeota archaeon]